MVDTVLALPEETKIMVLAPVVTERKGGFEDLVTELRAQGFVRLRIDGALHEIDACPKLDKNAKHSIDVVIDRLVIRPGIEEWLSTRTKLGAAQELTAAGREELAAWWSLVPVDDPPPRDELIASVRSDHRSRPIAKSPGEADPSVSDRGDRPW